MSAIEEILETNFDEGEEVELVERAKKELRLRDELIQRVSELSWAWENGKSIVSIGMRMNNVNSVLREIRNLEKGE